MALPESMRAVVALEPGGPEVLALVERPVPVPGPREVLIEVAAAGVNRPDILQREGRYPPPPGASDVLGLEVAGRIVARGPGAERFAPGELVCALVTGGGYAEYTVAPEPQCLPLPAGLDPTPAAALPETFFTVWTNVFESGRLAACEVLLVHGGGSGIGTTAIQLASARGALVLTTVGSAEKAARAVELGAEAAFDYRTEDFVAAALARTSGRGVDVVLDIIGGAYLSRNLEVLATGGRLVVIGLQGGASAELSLARLLKRRLAIMGSTLRPRSVAEKGAIARALEAEVWPLLASGRIHPVVHAVLPLARAAEAHRLLESSRHFGKVVLAVREPA